MQALLADGLRAVNTRVASIASANSGGGAVALVGAAVEANGRATIDSGPARVADAGFGGVVAVAISQAMLGAGGVGAVRSGVIWLTMALARGCVATAMEAAQCGANNLVASIPAVPESAFASTTFAGTVSTAVFGAFLNIARQAGPSVRTNALPGDHARATTIALGRAVHDGAVLAGVTGQALALRGTRAVAAV